MDKKKIILVVSIILIITSIIVSIFLFVNKDEDNGNISIDGIDTVKNEEVLEDRVIGDIKIINVSILKRGNISSFKAEVINTLNDKKEISNLYAIFYENDKEIKVDLLKDVFISALGSVYINIESEVDLSNIDKIDYVLE